jgi:hypothetical protein
MMRTALTLFLSAHCTVCFSCVAFREQITRSGGEKKERERRRERERKRGKKCFFFDDAKSFRVSNIKEGRKGRKKGRKERQIDPNMTTAHVAGGGGYGGGQVHPYFLI